MIEFFENDLKTLFPELFCVTCSVALVMFGASSQRQLPLLVLLINKRQVLPSPGILAHAPFGGAVILLYTFILLLHHPIEEATCCTSGVIIDSLGAQCKIILVCAGFFSLIVFIGRAVPFEECVCLMLLSITGGMLLISSGDLMSLFLSLEIQSLCFYVLAATGRTSQFSTEAGLKYLVLGAFSSGVLLFGCSLLYGFSGTTSLYEVSNLRAAMFGLLFILFGVLFKLGAAPFHSWVPDVYDGAPIFITTFFAAVPKVAILAFVLRLLFLLPAGGNFFVEKGLMGCSLVSLLIGAMGALSQRKLKRLFAYGAIAHVGYLLIGVCCATAEGVQWMFFYVALYALQSLSAFALLMCPAGREGGKRSGLCYLSELNTLMKTNRVLAASFAITLFSMAGIPPLAGFLGKYFILFSALNTSLYLLTFVGALLTVISCLYYLRVIHFSFFEEPSSRLMWHRPEKLSSWFISSSCLFQLLLFLNPNDVVVLFQPAGYELFG